MSEPSSGVGADGRGPVVEAAVEYLGPMTERPRFHMGDEARDRNVLDIVTVPICDIRPEQGRLSLDREGFVVVPHRSSVANFRDPEEIGRVYGPELERVLREVTGAAKVVVMRGGVVRLAQRSPEFGAPGTTYPAKSVHSDYTPTSGPAVAAGVLAPEEAETWLGRRYAIFSLWRALSPPPQDVPLALCDALSVAPSDVVLSDVVIGLPGREITFEGACFRHNPAHRWCYFRDMHRDELLIIKAYDTDDSRSWRVPHTGFLDPSAPADAPPRQSMDIRAVAFFEA